MTAEPNFAFNKDAINQLCTIARRTIEFHEFRETFRPETTKSDNLDSVLLGIESLLLVMDAYAVLVGRKPATRSGQLARFRIPRISLAKYVAFFAVHKFERKSRLLLDLVKMRIVFIGTMRY